MFHSICKRIASSHNANFVLLSMLTEGPLRGVSVSGSSSVILHKGCNTQFYGNINQDIYITAQFTDPDFNERQLFITINLLSSLKTSQKT